VRSVGHGDEVWLQRALPNSKSTAHVAVSARFWARAGQGMGKVKIGVAPHRLPDTIEVVDESATLLTVGRRKGAVTEGRLRDSGAAPDDRGPGRTGSGIARRQRG
jgi:hypothetical protein